MTLNIKFQKKKDKPKKLLILLNKLTQFTLDLLKKIL